MSVGVDLQISGGDYSSALLGSPPHGNVCGFHAGKNPPKRAMVGQASQGFNAFKHFKKKNGAGIWPREAII